MKNPTQNERINKRVGFLIFIYLMAIFGMFSLVFVVNFTKVKPTQSKPQLTYQNITASWFLDKEGTKAVDVKKFKEYMDPESGVLSIYYLLPELNADTSLVYRSKDVYTRVLVEDKILYETSVYDSPFYNKSPGNLWNTLNISSKYSGKIVEMQITMVYDVNAITVDYLYLGDKADIIVGICGEHVLGIIISFLLMLLGVGLVVMDLLPTTNRAKRRHGLWWVGFYALMMGVWSLIETNVLQFFMDDMRILQLIDNLLMMVSTLPLVLYVNAELGILESRVMRIACYLCATYGILCVAVQYSGVKDMHSMLAPSSIFLVTTDMGMALWLIRKCIKLRKSGNALINCLLMTLGVTFRTTCSVVETISAMRMDKLDRAELIRFGMLVLCICFAIGSQIETYRVIEQGMKYDVIRNLAYSDGLTGLGNRTAYLEELEAYKNNNKLSQKLGIVYLDVNDLKKVNDNYGHDSGDDLLLKAAEIIGASFGIFGKSYRVGGDEFCVLMTGNDIEENYKNALTIFQDLIDEANSRKENDYTVRIAHGFAVCEDFASIEVEEAIAKADREMYRNKEELKRMT